MVAKILAFVALLALSVSATTATSYLRYPTPFLSSTAISIPCVQYATLQQVLASGISPSSAIVLQHPLAILRQQCLTHLMLQGATSLPQQQALSIVQQQIVQQQLLPILVAQQQQLQQQQVWSIVQQQILQQQLAPLFLQQVQQQQQVLPILLQQVQQQVLLPYLFNIMNSVNPAAYIYSQQQQLSSLVNAAATAINPTAFYGQEQLFNQAAFGQQQLFPYFFNTLAANPNAFWQQPLSAGACF